MTIDVVYVTTGAGWTGGGSPLSPDRIDENFYNLVTAVQNIIDSLPGITRSIDHFAVSGRNMSVVYNDGTVDGPFVLPVVQWNFRDQWQPSTAYQPGDVVVQSLAFYIITWPHTSAGSFDPGANDGSGHDYYSLMFQLPSANVPQVDRIVTSSVTPTRDYISKYWRCDSAGDGGGLINITLNANVFAAGDEMHFRAVQTGLPTIVAGSGVTVNGVLGHTLSAATTGAVITVKCVSPTEFDVFGMLGT